MAKRAGMGAGYVVQVFRFTRKALLGRIPFPHLFHRAPRSFEDVLRKAIVAEAQRTGLNLTSKEVDDLVIKVFTLLEKVFSGELGIDAIPWAGELLRSESALLKFVTPLFRTDKSASVDKMEIMKRILEDNIQLRKGTGEEINHG